MVARRVIATVAMVSLSACVADIGADTYYCGAERLCPPGQVCDDNSFTCTLPGLAETFTCPDGSQDAEPDDVSGLAFRTDAVTCGRPLLNPTSGCISDVNDLDYLVFDMDRECTGADPRLEFVLVHPIALVPLVLELLDDSERVIATAEPCTGVSVGGSSALCIDQAAELGTFYVRISSDRSAGLDCDGACHFNRYSLSVAFPLN